MGQGCAEWAGSGFTLPLCQTVGTLSTSRALGANQIPTVAGENLAQDPPEERQSQSLGWSQQFHCTAPQSTALFLEHREAQLVCQLAGVGLGDDENPRGQREADGWPVEGFRKLEREEPESSLLWEPQEDAIHCRKEEA